MVDVERESYYSMQTYKSTLVVPSIRLIGFQSLCDSLSGFEVPHPPWILHEMRSIG